MRAQDIEPRLSVHEPGTLYSTLSYLPDNLVLELVNPQVQLADVHLGILGPKNNSFLHLKTSKFTPTLPGVLHEHSIA